MNNIFRVFAWVRRYPLLAASTLGCAIAAVLCGLVFPKAVQQIMDVVIPQGRGDLLGFWVLMTLGAYFARDLLNGLRIFLNNSFEQKVIYDLRSDLYARLQRLPLPWFDGDGVSPISARELSVLLWRGDLQKVQFPKFWKKMSP